MGVPEQEVKQDFIVSNQTRGAENTNTSADYDGAETVRNNQSQQDEQSGGTEFDLSDISMKKAEQSREEIIAAAEAAAFAEN